MNNAVINNPQSILGEYEIRPDFKSDIGFNALLEVPGVSEEVPILAQGGGVPLRHAAVFYIRRYRSVLFCLIVRLLAPTRCDV